MPRGGINSRFNTTFNESATTVFASCQPLRPPISRTMSTGPTPFATRLAPAMIASASAPSEKPGPNSPSTVEPNTISVK